MREGKGLIGKVIGLIILLIVIAAVLFVVPIPHTESREISASIPPLHQLDFYCKIPKGSQVQINLQVSGGAGTIFFNIVSPNGSVTRIAVLNSMSYNFKAISGGNYTFEINNVIAIATKNVTGSLTIHEDTPLLSYSQIKDIKL
ncbi:hypothetical protein [Sulfuracidifex tepidarius]|uniref:GOLD domain-containing protein n=1 Tax=Sulfuracidifex tepidarius TaxID=1294262 RepID=A0A510E0E2_9CREN|nr:hypothetical protein [Sulfuracidifex tepidarius]BBG22899.1 hypothetical protein IC006_0183 [Sulfuracidifex tepidarius]BBG25660.1 hypothetical protein IC007_0165 [Sulfuracidifex tepidarius]